MSNPVGLILKRIRREIRIAVKSGQLPSDIKCHMTYDHKVNTVVIRVVEGWEGYLEPEQLGIPPRYTVKGQVLFSALKALVDIPSTNTLKGGENTTYQWSIYIGPK